MSNDAKKTDHNYDGIEELDNSLPNWWLGILYGTIVFAAVYLVYYEIGDGPSLKKEYDQEHARLEYQAFESGQGKKEISEADLKAILKNPERIKQGEAVFTSKCFSCHGAHGQGGIGPNLTDDYWIHGGKLTEIARTISNGVADKGMPPWGPLLKEDEIQSLVAFIRSIRGSHPAQAKAPQGDLVKIED